MLHCVDQLNIEYPTFYCSAIDPPSQCCVYIPPGDETREVYRITTFSKYPPNVPVNSLLLAQEGCYYTGYKDRVKCFR